ncbi:MAG: response regulator [Phormidesmis sp.]
MTALSGYGLLLVEDDSNDVLLIQRAFRRANINLPLTIVQDGDEAVDYLQGEGQYEDRIQYPMPTLILLDLKLPRRSGLEVLEWLRAQPILRRIPVVVLTSSRENADIDSAYEIGVNSYLVKPVTFAALETMIAALNEYWVEVNHYPSTR